MNRDARNRAILLVLLLVVAALWYRVWQQQPTAGASQVAEAAGDGGQGLASPVGTAPSLNLEALSAERSSASPAQRNLFQYGAPVRSRAEMAAPVVDVAPPPQTGVAPAPAEPALNISLIGIVRPLDDSPRVAVLSDERGVYHGTEGTIIEGRYRIMRVDADSVELSTLDGTGRYVLRIPPS